MQEVPNIVEPRSHVGPRDWKSMFAETRIRYVDVLFHRFYYSWGVIPRCSLHKYSGLTFGKLVAEVATGCSSVFRNLAHIAEWKERSSITAHYTAPVKSERTIHFKLRSRVHIYLSSVKHVTSRMVKI